MTEEEIDDLVRDAARMSDRGEVGLKAFAKAFVEAHTVVPGGLSIEVGTRNGGSALLFLGLLYHLYPEPYRPCLWTVDPYGSKPYNGGDVDGVPIYTDANYVTMKKLLAPFPNHAHWMMRSGDFFDRMWRLPYWRPGQSTVPVQSTDSGAVSSAPVGDQHQADKLTFVLLDGEHDTDTIRKELGALFGRGEWMHSDGVVVIDNVDTDPRTRGMLERGTLDFEMKFRAYISENGQWAFVRRA